MYKLLSNTKHPKKINAILTEQRMQNRRKLNPTKHPKKIHAIIANKSEEKTVNASKT